MVEPIGFRANPETADDNAFQVDPRDGEAEASPQAIEIAVREEWNRLVTALESRGIAVETFSAPGNRETPDAVFPNNWFSTHPDGRLVLYPMMAPSRRKERRPEIVAWLEERYPRVIDLFDHEEAGIFLEGTGSLVIDERAGNAYANVSPRTDADLARRVAETLGHHPVVFTAKDRDGGEIYHTNVVLSVGADVVVVCAEAIVEPGERDEVLGRLDLPGRELVEITIDQMHEFCANVLELGSVGGGRWVAMSNRAHDAFTGPQRAAIERYAGLVHTDLTTIETYGGGSARCMIAELQ